MLIKNCSGIRFIFYYTLPIKNEILIKIGYLHDKLLNYLHTHKIGTKLLKLQ